MPYIPDIRGADLPSGGVRVSPPDLRGIAPMEVQKRVQAERAATPAMRRDAQGRPQIAVSRGFGGGGVNVITLPKFSALERMEGE